MVHTSLTCSYQTTVCLARIPITIFSWLAFLVYVIGIAEGRKAVSLAVHQSEYLCHPTIFCAHADFRVYDIATLIFLLQHNIERKSLLLLFGRKSECCRLFVRLVVSLQFLYREVRQILQHHLVVTLEEVLAVECKVINMLSVDGNLTVTR